MAALQESLAEVRGEELAGAEPGDGAKPKKRARATSRAKGSRAKPKAKSPSKKSGSGGRRKSTAKSRS